MAFAQTELAVDCTWTGTFSFYGLDQVGGGPCASYARLIGPGGTVEVTFVNTQHWDYNPVWPNFKQWARYRITGSWMGSPEDVHDEYIGEWKPTSAVPVPPPSYEYVGASEHTVAVGGGMAPIYLYKQRVSIVPEGRDPGNPCHSLDLGMQYTKGSPSYDLNLFIGAYSRSDTDIEMVPTFDVDGGGTRDMLALSATVGSSVTPGARPNVGLVAEVADVVFAGESVSFDGYRSPPTGTTNNHYVIGNGDSLQLYSVATPLGPHGGTATIYPPIIIDYDVDGYAWTQGSYGEYTIPDGYGGTTAVAAPYVARVTYWDDSWTSPSPSRPWAIPVGVDPTWAAEQTPSEVVDPDDAPCVIEECGLAMTTGNVLATPVEFLAEVNVAWPDDVRVAPPSEWTPDGPSTACPYPDEPCVLGLCTDPDDYHVLADDGSLEVYRTKDSQVWQVIVHDGASETGIKRVMVEDFFSRFTSHNNPYGAPLDWVATMSLPLAYRWLRHMPTIEVEADEPTLYNVLLALGYPNVPPLWPGSDVWNWGNKCGLRWRYTADVDFLDLTYRLSYSTAVISDTETIPDREEAFTCTRTPGNLVEYPLDFPTAATTAEVLVDLARTSMPDLRHVDEQTISGLANASGDDIHLWLEAQDLVPDPLQLAGYGGDGFSSFYPRPGDDYMPVGIVGWEGSAAGTRALRQYTMGPDPSSQAGLVFLNVLYSSAGNQSGLCSLAEMRDWLAKRAEGMTAEWGCENGDVDYDAAFVDGDAKDMLGGALYATDMIEYSDLAREPMTQLVPSYARPRVGVIYPASGVPIPCMVRKWFHHSAQGMLRLTDGSRCTTGGEAHLWAATTANPAPGEPMHIGFDLSNGFGRYDLSDLPGVPEAWWLGISQSAAIEPTVWYQTYNELRNWLDVLVGGLAHPTMEHHAVMAQVFLAYNDANALKWRLWSKTRGWVDSATAPFVGSWPQYSRQHPLSRNDLVVTNDSLIQVARQVSRLNEWGELSTVLAGSVFAAFGGHNEIGVVSLVGGSSWQFARFNQSTYAQIGLSETISESVLAGAPPALAHKIGTNDWFSLCPTDADTFSLFRRTINRNGVTWTLVATFAGSFASLDVSEREAWIAVVSDAGELSVWRIKALDGSFIGSVDLGTVALDRPAVSYVRPTNSLRVVAVSAALDKLLVYTSHNRGRTWSDAVELGS